MENQEIKFFNDAIKEIEKKHGKGLFKTNIDPTEKNEVISSGSLSLDRALGINGFPKGRIIEIFGNESSGKTTIALQAVLECQKSNRRAAYIDAENALDFSYVSSLGINTEELIVSTPDSGEQAFSVLDALIKTNMIDLVIVDSVAALIPQSELESEIVDQNIGAHARLMSKGLRMIQGSIAKSNTCVIFINQLREKVGVMFGNPEVTTGGRALKFYSSIRLDIRKSELIKSGNDLIGIKSKVTIAKNKMAPPLKTCFVDIYFGKGFNYDNEIINFAIEYEIIKKSGSWFYLDENKLGQGRNQLEKYFADNVEIFNNVKKQVIEKIS